MAHMRATAIIPEDIIVDIVTTLPIKSVGRCRCVCKRWCYLFSSPKFAKSHKQSALERQKLSRRLVLVTHEYKLLDLDLREKQKSSLSEGKLNAPFKKPEHSLSILGSCNGLVACLCGGLPESPLPYRRGSLFIWNPSTGFYKEIAGQDFYFRPGRGWMGFGYVSGTDDYKVMLRLLGRPMGELVIFSLRTRTWNSIKSQMDYPIDPMQNKGLLLREALHWLAYSIEQANAAPNYRKPIFVFALDLEKEEFRKMQLPGSIIMKLTNYNSHMRLGVSCEGCLYIMHYIGITMFQPKRIDDGADIDFWVMREYGNSESWTRSVTLRLSGEPVNPIHFLLQPILLMETSAFVMKMFARDKDKVPAATTHMYMVDDHYNKEKGSLYVLRSNPQDMIVYEESLSEYEEGQNALIPQGQVVAVG